MPRAILTGATGFIGRHLATALVEQGWPVVAITRPDSRGQVPAGVTRMVCPLTLDGLARVVAEGDAVIHLAGRTSAPSAAAYLEANAQPTAALAQIAARVGARLVYVSSQSAAGPAPASHPKSEGEPGTPCSAYGASKLAGETAVRATPSLEWCIVRPVAVYGPGDHGFLPLFRLARLGVLPMLGDPDAPYVCIHIADLVRGLVVAATSPFALRRTFFLGHSRLHTTRSIVETIAAAVGRRTRILRIPHTALRVAALYGNVASQLSTSLVFDRSKLDELTAGGFACQVTLAHDLLGFDATIDIPEGFAATAAWYRAHGWLRA